MKQTILIPVILFLLAACKNDEAKIESAATDNTGQALSASSKHDAMKSEESKSQPSRASTTTATPAKKKGWSNGAKGAVIGAGTGAVVGAVADKNHRARGAVLGAAVGTGAGYIIGDNIKKKDTLHH